MFLTIENVHERFWTFLNVREYLYSTMISYSLRSHLRYVALVFALSGLVCHPLDHSSLVHLFKRAESMISTMHVKKRKDSDPLATALVSRNERWIRIYPTVFSTYYPWRAGLMVSVRDCRISFLCSETSDSAKSRDQDQTCARLFFCALTFCSQSLIIMFAEFLASLAFIKTIDYDIRT